MPVLFLTTANDPQDHLHHLPEELRQIRIALRHPKSAGTCEVVERPNATVDDVLDVFQDPDYNDRISIFHFGGHASYDALQFLSARGTPELAHAGGLGAYLLEQRGLELVFLNGCLTQAQAQGLARAEGPLVIATSRRIKDEVARAFAARFYAGLASGVSIQTAYDEAVHAVETVTGGKTREIVTGGDKLEEGETPWKLYPEEGADAAKVWKLPAATRPLGAQSLSFKRSLFLLVRPWLAGVVLGVVVLFVQSVVGAYDGKPEEAWSWFLPNILPTLSALFAAIVANERGTTPGRAVSRSLFRLAFMVSSFYVLVLIATLFALPVVLFHTQLMPLEWLMSSSAYLGPLQGLTAGVLSYFYAAKN